MFKSAQIRLHQIVNVIARDLYYYNIHYSIDYGYGVIHLHGFDFVSNSRLVQSHSYPVLLPINSQLVNLSNNNQNTTYNGNNNGFGSQNKMMIKVSMEVMGGLYAISYNMIGQLNSPVYFPLE